MGDWLLVGALATEKDPGIGSYRHEIYTDRIRAANNALQRHQLPTYLEPDPPTFAEPWKCWILGAHCLRWIAAYQASGMPSRQRT